ncbi:MAG TPA: Fis family transcriptional regulator [Cyanobacteria bacterium UBA11369]|nr:Fis family transcriptional regulator [Cyanobacteria bacterium UBA11371]HBE34703.1 Fis family transcriptional regulator [Cyanobacteria bacterium UBA11368]HBE53762.1 Fis family transcriptional regulator [Cyanobacteria bacterium UBA11369]
MKLKSFYLTALIALFATVSTPWLANFPILPTQQVLAQTTEVRKAEANRLLQQGVQQYETDNYEAALQPLQQALTIYREIGDRAGETESLLKLGSTYALLGNYTKAIDYYQQRLALVRSLSNREEELRTLSLLGSAYSLLNDNNKALDYYQQSLALARSLQNRKQELAALSDLGDAFLKQGDKAKAIEYYQQSLALARSLQNGEEESKALRNLGDAFLERGDNAQALDYYQQSLVKARQVGKEAECLALLDLGDAYFALGYYAQAIEYYQQSLALARLLPNRLTDRLIETTILMDLGTAYYFLGEYNKAIEFHQQRLEIVKKIKSPILNISVRLSLIDSYITLQNYDKALEYAQQNLALARELQNRFHEKSALSRFGIVYYLRGDYKKAIEYLQQSLVISQQIKEKGLEAEDLTNLAIAYHALGNTNEAIEYNYQSLALLQETKDNTSTTGITLRNLGRVLADSGNLLQAEKAVRSSMEYFESQRRKLGEHDSYKVSFFDKEQFSTYPLLQQILIAQNRRDRALEIAESGRARAFVELLASRISSTNPTQSQPPSIEQIKQIAKATNATFVEYSIVSSDFKKLTRNEHVNLELYIWVVKPTGEIAFRRSELKSLKTPLKDLVANTRELIGGRSRGNTNQLAFAPGDRITLNDDVPNSPPWEVVSVNTQNATLTLRQPDWEQGTTIERAIADVASKTENLRTTDPRLQQLYQVLIQPIADLLPTDPNDRVIFIPQQELFLVPFPALQDAAGKYLIEKHTILSAPAIQVLELTHQQKSRVPGAAKDILVVGNPTMPKVSLVLGEPPQQLSPLPNAEREAQEIAQLLHAQPLIGARATKAAIVPQLPRARLIHLATHGILDDRRGLGSAIAFAPSGNDSGLLTAEEILDLKLNAELVVLSACNTGQGRITGDGVIGLSRSLISAGVPSVLVSLWSVPDAPTAFLMGEFYRHWQQQKLDKAQALRQAMLTTIQQHPHPKNWAAFTLIGEP